MAIVFISPKNKRRKFILSVTGFAALFLVIVSLVIFLPEIKSRFTGVGNILPSQFTPPEIKINFNPLDSNEVKSLEPFSQMQILFTYTAKDQSGKQTSGTLSANSLQDAQTTLESMGLEVTTLQEVSIGRSNPFASYY